MLKEELTALKPLQLPLEPPGGSILLRELVNSPNFTGAPLGAPTTPLLRAMVSAHSYVTMLVHVCRVGQVRLTSCYGKLGDRNKLVSEMLITPTLNEMCLISTSTNDM